MSFKKFIFNFKAFTLIEAIFTIFIFTFALGAIMGLVWMGYKTYGFAFEQALAISEAKKGIETMVREIREATFGQDGSFPIERAADKEFIFYSDIDKDGEIERVRYFLGSANSKTQIKECVSYQRGGSCGVDFSNFFSGNLEEAEVKVSVEGDFGWSREYAEIFAEGIYLGKVCQTGCSDCPGSWQGDRTFNVFDQAKDNFIEFLANASQEVDNSCNWQQPNHSMKAKFEFSFRETLAEGSGDFKKGVVDPICCPIKYPLDKEKVTILSQYVRNTPPIFEYFDKNGNKIKEYPARLTDTKLMKVFLIIDVNPQKSPLPYELESAVQLRNLKEKL
jgi:hypothetical protein